jgi:bifunctional ADP-heptose synthase (sugar kinase/adenylyltransferase)
MLSLRLHRTDEFDGGASAIALHLAALGAEPTLITALTDDAQAALIANRLQARGVIVDGIANRRQIATRNRYLVDQSKMMKVDEGAASPLDSIRVQHVAGKILAACEGAAAVILADFGYGMITGPLLDRVMPTIRKSVPIISADASGGQANLLRFRDADLLCPSERQVRQALNDTSSGLNAVVYRLFRATGARQALVTMGRQGLVAFDQCQITQPGESWERKMRGAYLPALAGTVIDPLGCGDALLATATASLAAGGSLQAAAYLGAIAAASAGQTLGNHPLKLDAVVRHLGHSFQPTYAERLAG